MRVHVMGAGGQLGREVVEALLDRGVAPGDIRCCARSPGKVQDLAARGLAVRRADYDDPDSMVEAFAGADAVYLIPTFAAPEPRVVQHGAAVDAALRAGAGRLLFASFGTGNPESLFGVNPFLMYAESRLRVSGLPWTILRSGMYLDPIADWAPELVQMGRLPYPMRRARVGYVCRRDLAAATAGAILDSSTVNRAYDLTGPAAVSMDELAAAVSGATGVEVTFESISEDEFLRVCAEGEEEVPESVAQALLSLYRAAEAGEFASTTGHVGLLAGRPAEGVEPFLRRALAGREG